MVRLARKLNHVGQIVLALGVVVGDVSQQLEQQGRGRGHDTRVAGGERQNLRRRLLGLGDCAQGVAFQDQAAIGAGIARMKPDHRHAFAAEDRFDVRRLQQGNIAVGDHHVPVEPGKRRLGRPHGVAGAQRRVLDRDAGWAQPRLDMGPDLWGVVAHHHHDALAAQRLGRIDGVIQHGAMADAVQHLGQRRLHPRALACGQDDGGAWAGLAGHGSSRRLGVPRRLQCAGVL